MTTHLPISRARRFIRFASGKLLAREEDKIGRLFLFSRKTEQMFAKSNFFQDCPHRIQNRIDPWKTFNAAISACSGTDSDSSGSPNYRPLRWWGWARGGNSDRYSPRTRHVDRE